jgi:alanyl-tRNA synthetase
MLTGNEIRSTFLKFFADRGHRIVRSSSLVPVNDPTLLFTNAGMNQFKDVFLGLEQREYTRATSSQKCVRAGGKHNDLENVGFTNRHHTFFEMLGNFSFGDYYKEEAIAYAWELLTSSKWFNIPVDKLYFSVFGGADMAPNVHIGLDHISLNSWKAVGAPTERIVSLSGDKGLKENFWAMGDTGPCGACSEIYYDMGPAASDLGHTDCKFPCDCGRYVEIWNLVFMQWSRDTNGDLTPLPKQSVDTGMGLERLAAVLQGKISNFDTDLFAPLISRAAELTGARPGLSARSDASLRIIADHARASTFLISDGVIPSNEGRGYVLRKILRRGIRHGRLLGTDDPFMAGMCRAVQSSMREAYPELDDSIEQVMRFVLAEERRFVRVLAEGIKHWDAVVEREFAAHVRELLLESSRANVPSVYEQLLNQIDDIPPSVLAGFPKADVKPLSKTLTEMFGLHTSKLLASGVARGSSDKPFVFRGATAFALYETYGLPLDLMQEAAHDLLLDFDLVGFEKAMAEQRVKARASWKGGHKDVANPVYGKLAETYRTEPDFYFDTSAKDCRIEAIVTKGGAVNELPAGAEGEIILDRTVFYSESGGQVSDIGTLWNNEHTMRLADVRGAYYPVSGLIAHRIVAKEKLAVGDRVAGDADGARREHIKRNHTATHLMHAALRNILGTHVKQAGSLVEPGRLRFDFSHFAAIDTAELRDIEQQVNDEILLNSEIQTDVTTIDDALASGALAFFGDRYPEQNVRVVTIPDPSAPRGFYSKELCGGTHVRRTGDIGVFKIAVEQSTAAGVRRIEAITGAPALADYQHARQLLHEITARLGVTEENLAAAIERAEQTQRQLEKQLETLKRKGALSKLDDLVALARNIKGVKVISAEIEGVDRETMRQLVDSLRQKLGSGVVVLGAAEDGKVALLAGVTKDLTSRLHAGKIVQATAKEVGGSGGGRPDLAEAGGKDTSRLKTALDLVYPLVDQML